MTNVIVTGGAGFIGSHLTEELVKQGHTVTVIDNFFTGKKENLTNVRTKINLIQGDIRNLELLKQTFQKTDTVFHQAALRSVPASLTNPEEYNTVNINGTYNVLEAARICGVRRVVFASSSSVYGDSCDLPQKEEKTGKRLSPYAISKYAGEDYCTFFHKTYGLETISLRYFNVFGPRQNPNSQYAAVIPLFITLLLQNKQPTIFGDGTQSRDFTYVTNVVHGNILAMNANKNVSGEVFNLAHGDSTSVNQLFETIRRTLDKNIMPIYQPERKGDVKHTRADTTKLHQLLKYTPVIPFEHGIKETVAWYYAAY